MILGIDEVGRGAWAGPLVVGAVIWNEEETLPGLTDSKKLSPTRRQELDGEIRRRAEAIGLGWVSPAELDHVGMSQALIMATERAVETLPHLFDRIVIDGTINFLASTDFTDMVEVLPQADLLIPAVSAASIVAKVARDRYMYEQDARFPDYGFHAHVGYGTARHRAAIDRHGVTPLHRLSFAPLQQYR